jgi:small-conductance mechanosensitive channel
VFHATSLALAAAAPVPVGPAAEPDSLTGSCGDDPGIACRLAWDLTHNASTAQFVRIYLAGPITQALRIAFVILLALFVRAVANRLINRVTERAATATLPVTPNGRVHRAAVAVHAAGMERRAQRARALGSIVRSGVSIVVFGIAALTILGDLGVNLTPLLLSTTVLGVALGFGAQNLVRDYLAGILMLTEDHYGVGDTINVKDVSGTVEAMTLLTTRLRDVNGVVWHVRNGTIESVGNESQGWSRAVIDYPVPYGEDLARVRLLMERAADSLYRERGWRKVMLEKPEVWGAQELSSREVIMRIVAKTAPMRQWEVARELRARVKATLDAAGVTPAGPDTIVITAGKELTAGPGADNDAAPAPGAAGAAAEPAAGALTDTAAEDPLEATEGLPGAGRSAGTAPVLKDEQGGPPA